MYRFQKFQNPNNQHDVSGITMDVASGVMLSDLLAEFTNFVKACGYSIPVNATLEFVEDDYQAQDGEDDFDVLEAEEASSVGGAGDRGVASVGGEKLAGAVTPQPGVIYGANGIDL